MLSVLLLVPLAVVYAQGQLTFLSELSTREPLPLPPEL